MIIVVRTILLLSTAGYVTNISVSRPTLRFTRLWFIINVRTIIIQSGESIGRKIVQTVTRDARVFIYIIMYFNNKRLYGVYSACAYVCNVSILRKRKQSTEKQRARAKRMYSRDNRIRARCAMFYRRKTLLTAQGLCHIHTHTHTRPRAHVYIYNTLCPLQQVVGFSEA